MNREQLANRLLATFAAELDEQVGAMNADLLALEKDPADAARLKSLFRVAHSLKGAARAAGVPPIEHACHTLETMLAEARDGRLTLGSSAFALLFSAADALADAGTRLKAGMDLIGSPVAALSEQLRLPAPGAMAAPVMRPPSPGPSGDRSDGQARGDGQVRVEAGKLDALLGATSQLLITSSRIAGRPAEVHAFHELAARSAAEWTRTARRIRQTLAQSDAPASLLQAIDDMDQRLGDLLRGADRVAAGATEDARALAHVTDEMADRVRRLRMRPFAEACETFPRMVRDLSETARKEVELQIVGGEVEVDRAVLDGLREALVPLLRNAVDHGIEPPAVRERSGKRRLGLVTITAALKGDRLTVTVQDDGTGLDVAAIRARLEPRGLPLPDDDRELARALFEGGLSTRAEATAISGRGVGLDVVRAAMERIRGIVDLAWAENRGTTFTLECPPTLATIRVLVAAVGSQLFAVPTVFVERLLRARPEDVRHAEGRDMVVTPAGPVSLVALARLLPPLAERPAGNALAVIVLRAGDRRLAVAVDDLVAEQEIVVRPVLRDQEPVPFVSGAAILGSGRVVLVLNPVTIVAAGLGLDAGPGVAFADARRTGRAARRILVVDDSITTRTLEQSILEAAGYDVVTAVDGADGWRVLQEHGGDLVVADVEMPRMDGFALCETIRGSKRFAKLPVVLVTALETPEHRSRGLEAGADAYIGKSSFDQQDLLETISQLVG